VHRSLAEDTIKIGVAGAHSGDLASYGLTFGEKPLNGRRRCKRPRGIFGKKVELVVEDDVCKPEVAANIATNWLPGV